MIRAGRAIDSFVAPTHSRPEFFNSLGYEAKFNHALEIVRFHG
jgi:hypothetical protein